MVLYIHGGMIYSPWGSDTAMALSMLLWSSLQALLAMTHNLPHKHVAGAFYTGDNDTHAANAANLAFYAKVNQWHPLPTILLHALGGLARDVDALQVIVIAVQYRLAPEAPFPAAVEDCWAAVEWTAANTSKPSNAFVLMPYCLQADRWQW